MTAPISPGTTVDRYRIDGLIGAGSMGDVFVAVDEDLDRKVAIKILSERHRDNAELRARFVREARAVAAISHPNVVQVFTTGTFDDLPYLAMEFLAGIDLGTSVKENGKWPSARAARATLDAAHGLDAAAKAGLIHRDVKPSNLVLLRCGQVKVTDFGLAKPVDPGNEPALTALGVVVGTPDYIAPEQARGDPIDERVDIYALGGTLFFLLVGQPPYRTGNKNDDKYLKVVARHLRSPIPDPHARDRSIDIELATLCQRMMAKKPVDRPGYAELAEELAATADRLERAGESQPISTTASQPGGSVAPTPFVGGQTPTGASLAADDPDDEAQTRVRMPTQLPTEDSLQVNRPGVARWLVALSIVSALIFLTGLGLLLFGPIPEPEAIAPAAQPASDAATPTAEPLRPAPR